MPSADSDGDSGAHEGSASGATTETAAQPELVLGTNPEAPGLVVVAVWGVDPRGFGVEWAIIKDMTATPTATGPPRSTG